MGTKLLIATTTSVLLALLALVGVTYSLNQPTTVEVEIPATQLTIAGFAPPGALVTIMLNNTTIASVTASNNGEFTHVVSSLNPGLKTISVDYEKTNKTSETISKVVSVGSQQNTTVTVLATPIVYKNGGQSVNPPQNFTLRGFAPPNSQVTLVSNTGGNFQTPTNPSGRYMFVLDSSQFSSGAEQFTVYYEKSGQTSEPSAELPIEILSGQDSSTTGQPDEPDIVVNPNQPLTPIILSPDNDQMVDDSRVTFIGRATPGEQVVIYINGQVAGSVIVGEDGLWEYFYQSVEERVLFQFVACSGDSCSLPSEPLELRFGLVASECEIDISLKQFRFWGISLGERITLSGNTLPFDAEIEIDWGDGVREVFSYVSDTSFEYAYQYEQSGVYNGSILVTLDEECSQRVYFSAVVDQYDSEPVNFIPLALAVFSVLPISLLANQLGKKFI